MRKSLLKRWYSITLITIFGVCFLILLLRIISVAVSSKLVLTGEKDYATDGSIFTFENHKYIVYFLPGDEAPEDVADFKKVGYEYWPYDNNSGVIVYFVNEILFPLPVYANKDDGNKNTLWVNNCGFEKYSKLMA